MIVLDTSTLVSATFNRSGVPAQAVRYVLQHQRFAISQATMAELLDVVRRPRLARFLDDTLRDEIIGVLSARGTLFTPLEPVADCRDPQDNKFLELALAANASLIVSSDKDLLTLNPWRGVRILRPAEYLAEVAA